MIILGRPHDRDRYIGIQSPSLNTELHKHRFFPLYKDRNDTMYYIKNDELLNFLKKVGVINE